MSELKYNYSEFLAFLLIYFSHVDMEFSDEEKNLIRNKFGEDTYQKMLAEFESMSDFTAYETILSYKGVYYPTPEQKMEIFESIKELVYADNDYNVMEQELMQFLDRMM